MTRHITRGPARGGHACFVFVHSPVFSVGTFRQYAFIRISGILMRGDVISNTVVCMQVVQPHEANAVQEDTT